MPSTPITITLLPASPSADNGGVCRTDSAGLYREVDVAGVVLDLALVGEAQQAALLAALRACRAGEGSGPHAPEPDTSGSDTLGPHTSGPHSQRGTLKAMAVNMLLLRATREQVTVLHALGDTATPPRCAPVDPTISQSLRELAAACTATDPETRNQAYSNTALALSMGISRQAKALRLATAAGDPLEQALSGAQAHAYDACVALHALALCHVLKTPPRNERTLQALGLALKGLGRVADAVSDLAACVPAEPGEATSGLDRGTEPAAAAAPSEPAASGPAPCAPVTSGHAASGLDGGIPPGAGVTPGPAPATTLPTAPPETLPNARSAPVAAAPGAGGAAPFAPQAMFWRAFVDNIRQARASLDALHWLANATAPCVRVSAGDNPESAMLV